MSDLSISNRPYNPNPNPTTACGVAAQGLKTLPRNLARTADAAVQCGLQQAGAGLIKLSERQVADGLRQTLRGKLSEGQIGKLTKIVTDQGGPNTAAGRTILAMAAGDGPKYKEVSNFFLKIAKPAEWAADGAAALGAVMDFFPRAAAVSTAVAGAGTLLSFAGIPLAMNVMGYDRIHGEKRAEVAGQLRGMVDVMRSLEEQGGGMRDAAALKGKYTAFPESHFGRVFEARSEALRDANGQPKYVKAYDAECKHWYGKLQSMPEGDRETLAKGFKSAMQVLHGASDWKGIENVLRKKAGL